MPTRWDTFPVELREGLMSNTSRLQQGLKSPGSARVLENFEPSVKGGYRRINGYTKYSDTPVPSYQGLVVQGWSNVGTTLDVANLHTDIESGTFISIEGITGTFEVLSCTYSDTNRSATLTLTSSLPSSPADYSTVTVLDSTTKIEGLHYSPYEDIVYAVRDGIVFKGSGSTWTEISTPDYGTILVHGSSQTGFTLITDGYTDNNYVPSAGDTFTIAGVNHTYTVVSDSVGVSGAVTLTIHPELHSSPLNNAELTFVSSTQNGSRIRFENYNFDGTEKTIMVDGKNFPVSLTGSTYVRLTGSTDVKGASQVTEFKNHLFFSKDDLFVNTAPFTDNDFNTGNGAASFRMPSSITGMITFREELIVFTEREIRNLSGSSSTDFSLSQVTHDLGCIEPDTIQEVGGDVLFLGPDGVRFLGATARIGDFNLSLASRNIQTEVTDFIRSGGTLSSLVVRGKNQYRIFSHTDSATTANSKGFIGTQYTDQSVEGFAWSCIKGIKVYRVSSAYNNEVETIVFSNTDGYVYRMESGSTFDGGLIRSLFYTPYISVNDPNLRKTSYKVSTYFDPEGAFTGDLNLKYDFSDPNKIQPNTIALKGGGGFSYFGEAIFGSDSFGGNPETVLKEQVTGSFFTVSFQYEFDGTGAPFTLDTILLEYSTEDRK